MAETLVDSYSESNQDSNWGIASVTPTARGQTLTAIAGNLSSCKFYLKKYGSPTGNAVAKLYTHSGTYGTSGVPTGAALATSDNFDVSTLTTSYQLIKFTFTGAQQYTLVNGTYYCIAIEYGGGDGSNYVLLGGDISSPTHSGNSFRYVAPNWIASTTNDMCFYVYIVVPDAWSQTCTETIGLTDSKIFATNKNLSDGISAADLITRIGGAFTKILSDTITLSDSKSFSLLKILSDGISLNDSALNISLSGVVSKALTDTITLNDSVSAILYHIWFLSGERSTTWTIESEDKESWNED